MGGGGVWFGGGLFGLFCLGFLKVDSRATKPWSKYLWNRGAKRIR